MSTKMADHAKFSCEICLRVFSRNANLRRHVRRSHAETRPPSPVKGGRKAKEPSTSTKCPLCDKTFSNKKSLSHHRRQKHRDAELAGLPQVTGQWSRSHRRVLTQKVALQFNSITGKTCPCRINGAC